MLMCLYRRVTILASQICMFFVMHLHWHLFQARALSIQGCSGPGGGDTKLQEAVIFENL